MWARSADSLTLRGVTPAMGVNVSLAIAPASTHVAVIAAATRQLDRAWNRGAVLARVEEIMVLVGISFSVAVRGMRWR